MKKIEAYCFADDRADFWDNFQKREETDFVGIYDSSNTCILPDMDACNYTLYRYHQFLWNKQCMVFKNSNKLKINFVHLHENGLGLTIDKKNINLGSDSFISICWHYSDMQNILENVKEKKQHQKYIEEVNEIDEKVKERRKYKENWSDWKKFIWLYLQKSNTIGGFIVFPRSPASINGERGLNAKIRDRFDLTLECIKRYYINQNEAGNPLLDVLKKDHEFFEIFGSGLEGFKNYIDFFILNSWIEEDKEHHYHVKSLLHDNETLDKWDFNTEKPLPKDSDEWWIFYKNIMDRLKERNNLIKMSI